jgi:hypothetical protein
MQLIEILDWIEAIMSERGRLQAEPVATLPTVPV